MQDRNGVDHNVFVVGGGHTGLAITQALRGAGVGKVSTIDAAADGQTGIWDNRARMRTLRTVKTLVGPDNGFIPLSFPAWYEASHGTRSFASVTRIARTDWADYLRWFQKAAKIPVRFETKLLRIEPVDDYFRIHLFENGKVNTETSRKVVLANGIAGAGAPFVPSVISRNLPGQFAHTSENIDFDSLRNKNVAVIGAAASAFDAAATALEAGAASVHMFCRKSEIPARIVQKPRMYPGAADHFCELPDALRWTLVLKLHRSGSSPPPDSISRVVGFKNFHLHLNASLKSAERKGSEALLDFGDTLLVDFVICGTGFVQNPRLRRELNEASGEIALWRDRYTPPDDESNLTLGVHPYLGTSFQFTEKTNGRAPYLKNLHCCTNAAFVSFGRPIGDVPAMRSMIARLISGISRDLFFDDFEAHVTRMSSDTANEEFSPDLYRHSIVREQADSLEFVRGA